MFLLEMFFRLHWHTSIVNNNIFTPSVFFHKTKFFITKTNQQTTSKSKQKILIQR